MSGNMDGKSKEEELEMLADGLYEIHEVISEEEIITCLQRFPNEYSQIVILLDVVKHTSGPLWDYFVDYTKKYMISVSKKDKLRCKKMLRASLLDNLREDTNIKILRDILSLINDTLGVFSKMLIPYKTWNNVLSNGSDEERKYLDELVGIMKKQSLSIIFMKYDSYKHYNILRCMIEKGCKLKSSIGKYNLCSKIANQNNLFEELELLLNNNLISRVNYLFYTNLPSKFNEVVHIAFNESCHSDCYREFIKIWKINDIKYGKKDSRSYGVMRRAMFEYPICDVLRNNGNVSSNGSNGSNISDEVINIISMWYFKFIPDVN